jgi:hypothetical protein
MPANAADSVDEAITALRSSPIYVAVGTKDTNSDTIPLINSYLTSKDHILVVMLPVGSTQLTNDEAALKIMDSTSDPSILALYANGEVTAYSNRQYVPSEVANRAMTSATNIAVGPTESITTFIKLIHEYQAVHPEPVTVTSTSTPKMTDSGIIPFSIGGGILVTVVLIATIIMRRRNRQAVVKPLTKEVAQFQALADDLGNDIRQITRSIDRSSMEEMLRILRDVVKKTEEDNPAVLVPTAKSLAEKLNVMRTIVGGYLDNQQYPDLPGAQKRLRGYGEAFGDFELFAKQQMTNLLNADFQSLQFEISRWKPQDSLPPNMLDIK